jgi:uncharacterized cupredoxin-like copper-binding protein
MNARRLCAALTVRRLAWVAVAMALTTGSACGVPEATSSEIRTVHITIHFSSFDPTNVGVAPGETVRFIVENTDPIDHEFLIGDEHIQQIHEEGTEAYHPPKPGEITVPAATTRTTTYTFPANGDVIFGCHLPGHYAYGMRGTISIG